MFKTTPPPLKAKAATLSEELTQAASTGSPTVRNDVKVFVTDLQAGAAAGDLNVARLTAEGYAFAIAACTPSGAPATGGGSSAGLQDPVLFGVGGAAALAGIVVISVAVRSRPRDRRGCCLTAAEPDREPVMPAWTRRRIAVLAAGVALIAGGGSVLGLAVAAQQHAPQPGPEQAGAIPAPTGAVTSGAPAVHGPVLARSQPVSISIPTIGVTSQDPIRRA